MWKRLLISVMTAAMAFTLLEEDMYAAEAKLSLKSDSYTYTVRFYVGNQGTISNTNGLSVLDQDKVNIMDRVQITQTGNEITVSGLKADDQVGFNAQTEGTIRLNDADRYYVKGVRLSGRDNGTVADSVFVVDGDADYVVAYGIKGDQVKYTVKYVHENGKTLAANEIFYGNVGDKPVAAYKYIEGYTPKVLGLAKTLSENEGENIFTFVYEDAPENTIKEIVNEDMIDREET